MTILMNKKFYPYNGNASINLNLLICSLFTLIPNDEIFKELNINKYGYLLQTSEDFFLMDSYYLNNFFLILNKPLVRQLAYNILQPLFKETGNLNFSQLNIKKNSLEYQALKKYLKKFKYFYKILFKEESLFNKFRRTEKEINLLAIKFLFILVGV
jgi:hypothetical protein